MEEIECLKDWQEFENKTLIPIKKTAFIAKEFNPSTIVFSYIALRQMAISAFKAGIIQTEREIMIKKIKDLLLELKYRRYWNGVEEVDETIDLLIEMVSRLKDEEIENERKIAKTI